MPLGDYPLYAPYELEENIREYVEYKRFEEYARQQGMQDLHPFFAINLLRSLRDASKGLYFIYGPKGSGKTRAIFRIIDGLSGRKVLYGRLKDFDDVDPLDLVQELKHLRSHTYVFLDDFLNASFIDDFIYYTFQEGLFEGRIVLVLSGSKDKRVLSRMIEALEMNRNLQGKEPEVPLVFIGPRSFSTFANFKGISTLPSISKSTMFYKYMVLKFISAYALRRYLSMQEREFSERIAREALNGLYKVSKGDAGKIVSEVLDEYLRDGSYPQTLLERPEDAREMFVKIIRGLSDEELEVAKKLAENAFRPVKIEDEEALEGVLSTGLFIAFRKIEPGEDPFELLKEDLSGREVLPVPIDPQASEAMSDELNVAIPRLNHLIALGYHLFLNALFFIKFIKKHISEYEPSFSRLPLFFGVYRGRIFFDAPVIVEPHKLELLLIPRERIGPDTVLDLEPFASLGLKHATTPILVPKDYVLFTTGESSRSYRANYDFFDVSVEPSEEDLESLRRKRSRYNTYAPAPKPHERSIGIVPLYALLIALVPRKRQVRSKTRTA